MGRNLFLTVLLAGALACPLAGLTAGHTVQQPPEPAADKVTEEAVQQAAEQAVEKVAEKAAEIAATQAAEKAAEQAAEMAVEKAAEKAAEEAAIKKERPDQWRGPTRVHFLVFVVDIDNIDGASQTFTANVYVSMRWQDRRLASDGWATRQMPLEGVWNPRVLLTNEGGIVRQTMPQIVEVAPDGTVVYRQRYVGPLSQPLRLTDFPLDEHRFVIQFAAAGYRVEELEFVPDVAGTEGQLIGGSMADQLSLPDWKITDYAAVSRPYAPVAEIETAGFAFEFTAKRFFVYYLWQLFVPLSVIVAMSWAAFWIDPSHTGAQIGIATSSVLTLIAYRFVVAGLLPRLPYMTRIDYFVLGSTLLVFLALVEVILTSHLTRSDRRGAVRWIDRLSRVAFPVFFLLLYVGTLCL